MTCNESNMLLQAYLDNELDTTTALAFLEHAATCAACKARLEDYYAIKQAVAQTPQYRTPDSVRSQILTQFRPKKKVWRMPFRWGVPLATGLAFGVVVTMMILPRTSTDRNATDDIVWDHIHALKSGHLIDVASSDKHTVKPWFAGKADFSPLVIDLASDGFPLLGARAEYLAGHDAAALMYTNGKHFLSLYEWSASGDKSAKEGVATIRGYHSSSFTAGTMQCCVVSDASPEEVSRFQRTLLATIAGRRDE